MDAGREEEKDGLTGPDSLRTERLRWEQQPPPRTHPPRPPQPLYRPVSAVQLLLACHSVSLPVRPFVSAGLSGAALSFSSPLCSIAALPPPLAFCHFCHFVNLLFSEYARLS